MFVSGVARVSRTQINHV